MPLSWDSLGGKQIERLLASFVDERDAGHCLLGQDYRFVWASDNFLKVYGHSGRAVIGQHASEIFGQDYFDARGKRHFDRCLDGERIDDETWVDFPPRGRHFFSVAIRPVYLSEGEEVSHVLWIERDLTRFQIPQHGLLQEGLLEEGRKMDSIMQAMQAGTWVWNVESGETWYNERWAEIMGYRLEELWPVTVEKLEDLTHAEDRKVASAALNAHFSGESDFYRCEMRVRHKDGHWVWVEDRGRVYEWKDGKPLLMSGGLIDITDKKENEETTLRLLREREENERRLRKVTNSIPGAVFEYKRHFDGWDEIVFGNEQVEDIFGVSLEDAMCDVSRLWDGIDPEDLNRVKDSVNTSARELSFWNMTWRIRTPSGEEKVINGRGQPHREPDGSTVWDTIVFDLTDLHRAQEALNATNFRMSVAADSAGFGFWEIRLKKFEEIWDDQMYRLFGLSRDSEDQDLLTGTQGHSLSERDAWFRAVHPDDVDEAGVLLDRCVKSGEPYNNVIRVIHPDGAIRHLRAHAKVMYDKSGVPDCIFGVNYDITEMVEAEQQLRLSEKQAREANEAKSQFLSVMNHELRTPLNSIIGPIEMLEHADLEPDERELLSLVKPAADHLLALINDILNLSKMEAGQYVLKCQAVYPDEFLREKIKVFYDQAEKKSVGLCLGVDSNLPDCIESDPYALTQILYNLVSNALKFTPQGGEVKVDLLVEDQEGSGERELCLLVEDTGCGIAEDQLERIFDPFYQANAQPNVEDRSLKGTGLGLSICRDLAKMLGGGIYASSNPGVGSVFALRIPLVAMVRQRTATSTADAE